MIESVIRSIMLLVSFPITIILSLFNLKVTKRSLWLLVLTILLFSPINTVSAQVKAGQGQKPDSRPDSKLYIEYNYDQGRLVSNSDVLKSSVIYCVPKSNMITDEPTSFFNPKCGDDACKSTFIALKLGFCIEGVFDCDTMGVSERAKQYYTKVLSRVKFTDYPVFWNDVVSNARSETSNSGTKTIESTIIGSEISEHIREFDDNYDRLLLQLQRSPEARKNALKYINIDQKMWYIYRTIVTTRGFSVEIKGKRVNTLAVDIDMANHASNGEENAGWRYDDTKNAICLYATKNLRKGDEITLNYGVTDSRSSCLNYGFYDPSLPVEIDFNDEKGEVVMALTSDRFETKSYLSDIYQKLKTKNPETVSSLCRESIKMLDTYSKVLGSLVPDTSDQKRRSCVYDVLLEEAKLLKVGSRLLCNVRK
ncbi:set domain containing protein [Yasminevirus sp. GU-2018]|uniref:Set domain containing protein n=1 Tax=Yasminevirus sp. GU-2018 TaxID=2420051 RepID=A0A5K0U9T5_9VIRU|nr:set domain containing protein [Yasminevirus sp. GU-2018]